MTDQISPGRPRRRAGWHWATAVTGTALLAAACAGTVSTVAAGSTDYQKAVAYAQCMRTHGAPDWPEPNSQGVFVPTVANRADAACIRAHGYPGFPDSGRGPGITVGQLQKLGIDPNSPQFQSARRACLRPLTGVLP